jgi:hypothetical protein
VSSGNDDELEAIAVRNEEKKKIAYVSMILSG